jgi:hypothetical protein
VSADYGAWDEVVVPDEGPDVVPPFVAEENARTQLDRNAYQLSLLNKAQWR